MRYAVSAAEERNVRVRETLRAEATIAADIDRAIANADFSDVPPPNFSRLTPNPRRVLADLASQASGTTSAVHDRLAAEVADLPAIEAADESS